MKKMKFRLVVPYKYQIWEVWRYQTGIKGLRIRTDFIDLYKNGVMRLAKGYAWNGSSWSPDKDAIVSSAFHDAFYQLLFLKLINKKHRKAIDQLFRRMLIDEGMKRFLASVYYRAVRMFGRKSIDMATPEKIYTAP